jgi:2-polyprenyl-3-methyl-5-hydroxy-6-metoxy-1,4-benzoquinol methylase
MPQREKVATFYPSGYWQESQSDGFMQKLQARYIEMMLKWDLMGWFKRLRLSKESKIVDVGCSRGDWLALIKAKGHTVLGLEADPRAAHAAKRRGIEISEETAETWKPEAASVDAILAFHLIEHLLAPKAFLKACFRGLKPGGKILIRVPNIGSLQYRMTKGSWKGLEMPRHLVMYRPKPLAQLVQSAGFTVLKSSTWSLRDGPPCLSSSLLPSGEPTWREIRQIRGGQWRVLAYLLLTWALLPLELLASMFRMGAMITIIAEKPLEAADEKEKSGVSGVCDN